MMPPSRRAPRGALPNGCTANLQALSNTTLSVRFVQRQDGAFPYPDAIAGCAADVHCGLTGPSFVNHLKGSCRPVSSG